MAVVTVTEPARAKYVAEFIGTFLLVFTVGCNVVAGSPTWGVTSIAAVLMVSIYALGGVSGGNFNPAVSVALGLSNQFRGPGMMWRDVGIYCAVQILAGILGGLSFTAMLTKSVNVGPQAGFSWWQAMLAEIFYTFVLVFVVLNTAVCKKSQDDTKAGGSSQYFGFAIAFSVVAGGYGAGAISGGCFNPAVAIGLDLSSAFLGFGWCFAYLVFELLGAVMAFGLFRVVRPEDFGGSGTPGLKEKCVAEFIGTFVLVLTVGLNVLSGSLAGAWSIAAALMCMIFALGDVSGAHFNPAVTVAIMLSGRGNSTKQKYKEGGIYIGCQLGAGIVAAIMYSVMHRGDSFGLGPVKPFGWVAALLGEIVFTFVLCYVVLCVATVSEPLRQYFGFAIGSCVTAGGLALGGISGGSLNPAVSVGISTSRLIFGGGVFWQCLVYSLVELVGAVAAVGVFHLTHPEQYDKTSLPIRDPSSVVG